jgi:5-methylthioadenosine/S-adenosylhomocysteine deaminase
MVGKGFIEDGLVAVEDRKIVFAGRQASAPHFDAEVEISAKGKVAIPGLINCHTHLPMTLFRGLAEDMPLDSWLKKTIWPLESKLKSGDVYDGALLGCLEMIKSGVTCFADMYFHEDMVAKTTEESGLRAVLAEGIIGLGKGLLDRVLLKRSVAFARRFNKGANGRVSVMLGPHSVYSCSQRLLESVSEEAAKLGIGVHIHLAESKAILTKSEVPGLSEVEFLDKIGFFRGHVLAAHCIDLSAEDRHILATRGVKVAYVPVANMKLGLGAARIADLLGNGVCVGFGTDGPASNNTLDMFETMKIGALLQKHAYRNPRVLSAYEALRMATIEGAKALGLENEVGSLEVGKKADIVLIDFSKPHLKPLHDIYASIVYSAHGSDVDTVIVDGRILMQNRQVKTLNEQAVLEKVEKTAFNLASR